MQLPPSSGPAAGSPSAPYAPARPPTAGVDAAQHAYGGHEVVDDARGGGAGVQQALLHRAPEAPHEGLVQVGVAQALGRVPDGRQAVGVVHHHVEHLADAQRAERLVH
jgi:hypothetical protein